MAYDKAAYQKKYNATEGAKKDRAALNAYNHKQGTYGNGDGLDASHMGGKIVGFETEHENRGRKGEGGRIAKSRTDAIEKSLKA